MQKTYWWRVVVLFFGAIILGWGYVVVDAVRIGLCDRGQECFFSYNSFVDPSMFLSLSLLVIAPLLFFIRDIVFIKWLKFAIAWFVLAIILIALVPVSTGGWMSFGPTKESVSIWMGSLFVILSLIQIIWESKKIKKG